MAHFLADDDVKIHLQISGEGTPIVMLHGWTSSHHEWYPFLGMLHSRRRIFRWDARGHGGHPCPEDKPPTVQRMARDLLNLLEHYDLWNVIAVGHSMGALTLWQYIRDYGTERLAKACFIDQSPKLLTSPDWEHGIYGNFDDRKATEFAAELQRDFAESVLRLTALGLNSRAKEKYLANASGWQKSREALRAQNALPLIECWRSLTAADYRDVLQRIDIPSLLIYGGESNFYGQATAHYVAAQIPRAVLRIYEGTDHSPHQWQRERFARELTEFIDTPA